MKNRFSGMIVKLAQTQEDWNSVIDLRKKAYSKYEWSRDGEVMAKDRFDDLEWCRSLLALRNAQPVGTMRLIKADSTCLTKLLSYKTWSAEINDIIESENDILMEFNRFAVSSTESFPVTACALLKTAMAIQIDERISLILGEVRKEHNIYYENFLCMKPSAVAKPDGRLPVEYHLVTGRPAIDIGRLRMKTNWMVPNENDVEEWRNYLQINL